MPGITHTSCRNVISIWSVMFVVVFWLFLPLREQEKNLKTYNCIVFTNFQYNM